jgi:hypothetical protein
MLGVAGSGGVVSETHPWATQRGDRPVVDYVRDGPVAHTVPGADSSPCSFGCGGDFVVGVIVPGQRVTLRGDRPDGCIEWRGLGQFCSWQKDPEVFQPSHLGGPCPPGRQAGRCTWRRR